MLKRFIAKTGIISFTLAMCVSLSYAAVPENLSLAKRAVVEYHDSGEYDKDIEKVATDALDYLKSLKITAGTKKPTLVLDIDETVLSNYPHLFGLNFGGSKSELRKAVMTGDDKPIVPVLKLYQYAIANHITVVFITGRFNEDKDATIKNLTAAGFPTFDKIIFRVGKYRKETATAYKSTMRKQLTEQGYDIIMNVGDQASDLDGGNSGQAFKLPNPYYYIP